MDAELGGGEGLVERDLTIGQRETGDPVFDEQPGRLNQLPCGVGGDIQRGGGPVGECYTYPPWW